MEDINFDELVGSQAKLYYGNGDLSQFQLGKVLFEVVEDREDGYRSSMNNVQIISRDNGDKGTKFLADVTIYSSSSRDTYILKDSTDHQWLEFGTDHSDNWYPYFVFEWTPKDPNELKRLINI